tara:strand:- start:264 stop:623 length:360 start_codon:yes stop_codon:yes gene_type:complete
MTSSIRIMDWINRNSLWLLLGLLIFTIVLNIFYQYGTRFEKVITVDEKYTYGKGSGNSQSVSDKDNNIYFVRNSIYFLHFSSLEVFNSLDTNRSYKINGFGIRVPALGLYPIIIKAVEV